MNPPSPRLVITDAAGRRQVPIDKGVVTLGRRSESDVRVAGTGVSRQHAEITADNGSWRLRDCDSKFGTFVNGARATDQLRICANTGRAYMIFSEASSSVLR